MIYFIQILKMLTKDDRKIFLELITDLSYEIEECGYENFPEDLIEELLMNHFHIEMECDKQLGYLTDYILKNQNRDLTHLLSIVGV